MIEKVLMILACIAGMILLMAIHSPDIFCQTTGYLCQ